MRSVLLTLTVLATCPVPGPDLDDDDATVDDDDPTAPWYCAETAPGTRYDLYAEIDAAEADEIATMLEAAFDAYAAWWGVDPADVGPTPFRVELYADAQAFYDAVEADGLEPPVGAGGYFHSSTGIAYLYAQPTVWFTRVLALHEVAHQFHHAVRADGHFTPGWYSEGLAEYLSLHDWDDGCLRVGRLPMLSLEDLPRRALDAVDAGELDLAAHLGQDGSLSRPLEWGLFGFLDDVHHAEFVTWRDAMDAGDVAFEDVFGHGPGLFDAPLASWIEDHQQPMTPTYLQWIHRQPGTVYGWADGVMTIAPVKESVTRFAATFDFPPPGTDRGIVLGFDDPSNYLALLMNSTGAWSAFTVTDGNVTWPSVGATSEDYGGRVTVSVVHGPDSSTISAQTEDFVVDRPFTGAGGAAIYDGDGRFEDIAYE